MNKLMYSFFVRTADLYEYLGLVLSDSEENAKLKAREHIILANEIDGSMIEDVFAYEVNIGPSGAVTLATYEQR